MTTIYHITTRPEWTQAKSQGNYKAPSLEEEGFIHCSARDQILDVANMFYRDVPDLVILVINESAVEPDVIWEDPAHPEAVDPSELDTAQFPHIYGPLNVSAVMKAVDFPLGPDDLYHLPDDLGQ